MPLVACLKRDTYRDSVELMRLSAELAGRPGVKQFSAMMATPANIDLLRAGGLLGDELAGARPNDLCLAAEADDLATAEAALAAAEELLERKGGGAAERAGGRNGVAVAHSLRGALAARPDLNLALISVPGEYAAAEARRALRAGLHVMLFSDNVPLEQEVALKEEADRRGLLCMGPDCGTALIGGVPLGFANRVRRGRIGLVAASGTGLQAVSCQIHQLGEGVSHALGCGGRDLQAAVSGRATLAGLSALASDPGTEVLVVISKPGDAAVEGRVLARAAELGKPVVFHFLGRAEPPEDLPQGSAWAASLEETARAAVALARGESVWQAVDHAAAEREGREVAAAVGRGTLAGLFTGGTLAAEAAEILAETLGVGGVGPHPPAPAPGFGRGRVSPLPNPGEEGRGVRAPGEMLRAHGHVIVDLGDDAFTRGRPHPIIDPSARAAAIERAVEEGAALLLLDVVLGYGAHADPAGALIPTLERVRQVDGRIEVLAAVVGTDQDPQPLGEQVARLRAAGVRVCETPTMAARISAHAAALVGRFAPVKGEG